jgi:hypothetical protein
MMTNDSNALLSSGTAEVTMLQGLVGNLKERAKKLEDEKVSSKNAHEKVLLDLEQENLELVGKVKLLKQENFDLVRKVELLKKENGFIRR